MQVLLESLNNNGYFTCRRSRTYDNIFLNYSYKINIHTIFAIIFGENRAVYEIMSKNTMETGGQKWQ
jgi:transcription initiation factor IIE alpha subunit